MKAQVFSPFVLTPTSVADTQQSFSDFYENILNIKEI